VVGVLHGFFPVMASPREPLACGITQDESKGSEDHASSNGSSSRWSGDSSQACLADLDAIADATIQRCAQNDKRLRALDISATPFRVKFFTELAGALRHNTTLQELYLDSCQIDDEAIRVLSQGLAQSTSHAIRALSLEDNQIRCRGASHLAKALAPSGASSRWARSFGGYSAPSCGPGRGLQYLSLKGNAVSCVGAKAIAEVLISKDDSLESLSLEGNRIGDWGAGWFAMAVRNHNVLRHLDLHRNPIGSDGIEELKTACVTARASLVLLPPGAENKEEGLEPLVMGRRLATVYVTEVADAEGAGGAAGSGDNTLVCSAQRLGAYRRPGSASRRQPFAIQRRNRTLKLNEPGALMADSPGDDPTAAGVVPSKPARRPSAPGLACGMGCKRRRAPPPTPSSISAAYPPRAWPGERAVAADEKETTTVLVPPSRWCWKPRGVPEETASHGCGAAAARSLRRARSAPGRRCGMVLGATAATGMYGCAVY